ncbi:papain family cysteine protease domain containing protein [Entamoeba nuttalli P19]|uniref:Papain family cysteine protease domain containing protein n=1 Tax=Entamoeba nuttalli (strain P19) TaxID=1076696 RepID=K2HDE2_ENTNP|nr:papain family cysteine protease domain containing protein [Entamoeba nuttalli P19]EKE40799.1 papain family cysteine protease domain containing protein [Entamoeba nuttalli P19]|eukprot:XP_008856868.1 papain family cysteine protease domain containing protein [Entamoeba nuttalli P19]
MMQSNILFPRQGKDFLFFILLFVSLVTLVVASLCVYVGIFVHLNTRIEDLEQPTYNTVSQLPVKFIIPWEALTPAKDQGSRSTCWSFATSGFLESAYNSEAKKNHGHSLTSYVSFSEQVFGIKMIDTCSVPNPSPYCTNGQRSHNASDGLPEWLYYFKDVNNKWAVPENACPYKPTEDQWNICPELNKTLESNPVQFTVNNITTVYSISDVKNLLVNTKLPVTWTHGLYNKVFRTKCSRLSDQTKNADCVNKRIPCEGDYCYEIEISSFDNNGVFDITGKSYISGVHSMLIVGWNDDFRINRNAQHRKINEYSKGGFIVKNSWGFTGHSAGYWMSNHSTVQEDALCPNFGTYQNWIPIDYECFKQSMNATECANGFYRIVQLQRYNDGTILKCSEMAKNMEYATALGFDYCAREENKGKELRFALQSEKNVQVIYTSAPMVKIRYTNSEEGQAKFYLMVWEDGSNTVEEIITDPTTYQELEKLFVPVVSVENTKYCGYYFIPYDVFKFGNSRFLNYGDDTIAFSSFNITFDKTSFLDEKNGGYNYSALEKEVQINKFTPLDFKGPYIMNIPQ